MFILMHTALVAGSGDRGGAACENTGGNAATLHSICSNRLKIASMALGWFDPDRLRFSKNLFFALGGIALRAHSLLLLYVLQFMFFSCRQKIKGRLLWYKRHV